MRNLKVSALPTDIYERDEADSSEFHPLLPFLIRSLERNKIQPAQLDGAVLAITSKIVSVSEGAIASGDSDKKALIRQEADVYLGEGGHGVELTVKHGLLIPSSGIDESNSRDGSFILFPRDPFLSARQIWQGLREHFAIRHLGVILTDSHTTPLRMGVTGIALSYWGFEGVTSKVDEPDLFGRKMKFTHIDIADALAVATVLVMGEAGECTPLAIAHIDGLKFRDEIDPAQIRIPLENDLYYPLLKDRLGPAGTNVSK